MRKVGKKESYERKASVEGQVVKFQHLTLHSASNTHYLLNTAFDFTGVPASTVLRLAGENRLIAWRTAFKNAEQVDDTADNTVVKVADWLKGRKPRMSVNEQITTQAGKMSKDQIAKAIADLQAIMEAKAEEQLKGSEDDESEEPQFEGEALPREMR